MRRASLLFVALLLAPAAVARAQRFILEPDVPRAWLVLSDGVGPNGGGLSNSSGLVQLFRASGTVAVTPTVGVEVSALRVQEIYPANKLFNDPALNSPIADGLTLAVASLTAEGDRTGFPASFVLGGGVMRRPTNDPTKKKLTGGFMAGIEAGLWRPTVDWVDAAAGARLILMPSANHHQIYMLALTLGLRFG
jgi:hypothetical protein